jgi:hypothetical protein
VSPSARFEVLSETDQGKEHRGNPRAHTMPLEASANEQAPRRGPAGPPAPDEGGFETFVNGAGI